MSGAVETVASYGDWMRGQGLRPNTVTQRMTFAATRLREWESWPQESVALADWIGSFDGWTALTYYTHLNSVYRWLIDSGQLEHNPMEPIRRPRTPKPRPRPLTPSELATVLDGTTGHLRAWMLLAAFAGLRAHEVAKIRGEDVDEQGIRVIGKGGQAASVPTHPDLWMLAQAYPRRGYWFPSPVREGQPYGAVQVGAMVAKRFREVGIEQGSIHRLRATFGTNLVRQGASLLIVQTLMRHSSLATTQHYLGVAEDERSAAVRLLGYWPSGNGSPAR